MTIFHHRFCRTELWKQNCRIQVSQTWNSSQHKCGSSLIFSLCFAAANSNWVEILKQLGQDATEKGLGRYQAAETPINTNLDNVTLVYKNTLILPPKTSRPNLLVYSSLVIIPITLENVTIFPKTCSVSVIITSNMDEKRPDGLQVYEWRRQGLGFRSLHYLNDTLWCAI